MQTKKSRGNNPFNFLKNNFMPVNLLPSPEILQKNNSVVPGLADRLVAQAEKQTIHRIALVIPAKAGISLIKTNIKH